MSKKSTTQQNTSQTGTQSGTSTSSVGETPDIAAARGFQFRASPRIGYAYGQARNKLAQSFQSPTRGNYTANMRDAMLRSGNESLSSQQAQAEGEAGADLQGQQFGQKLSVASMTAPRIQTSSGTSSGTGTGTSTTSSPIWPDLLAAGAGGAAA